jgi:hypothetical protein
MANKRTDEENVANVVTGGASDALAAKSDNSAMAEGAAGTLAAGPWAGAANIATEGKVMENKTSDVLTGGVGRAVSSGGKDTEALKQAAVGTLVAGPYGGIANVASDGKMVDKIQQGGEWVYNKLAKEPTSFLFGEAAKPVKQTAEEKAQKTAAYYTQGIAQPGVAADRTGMYANAMPTVNPALLNAAQNGQFNATASTAQGATPEQAQQWASQMQGADVAGAWQGVNMNPALQYNTAVQQGQEAGMAPELLNQLMAASRGQGPSAAQAQLQAGMDQAISAQAAQAASARGAMNPAVLRQQQQQLAQATQQQAGQAATLSAQEQQQAMQTAAQALAQQRGIASQENTTSMQVQAEIQKGNFQAAQDLVKQQVQQRFDSSRQQTDAINQALAQGQIDQGTAERLNAELKTRVAQTNAETIFKAAQGDQAAELESQALKAQVIDNWVKSGMAYDQAQTQADQFWAQFQQDARVAAAQTATSQFGTKSQFNAQTQNKGALSGIASLIGSIFYKGGVVQGYACGGVAKPRVNMAQGGMVDPQAVASGGLAVHPEILNQPAPQPATPPPAGAPIPGDHPANDVVSAQLSPGEIVIPRSAVSSGRSGILSFIDALDKEGKLGEARGIATTPSYGEVLQAKQKLKNV